MERVSASSPSFPGGVFLLWKMARRRARGRAKRQQELLNQRRGRRALNLGVLAYPIAVLFGIFLHLAFAFSIYFTVEEALKIDAQASGRMVVDEQVLAAIQETEATRGESPSDTDGQRKADQHLKKAVHLERKEAIKPKGQSDAQRTAAIQEQYRRFGMQGFISETELDGSLAERVANPSNRLARLTGSLMLGWWLIMIVFQGEGLDLDVQRRRHPMWEWLLSHPVTEGTVFFAEMLSPLVANPNIVLAPAFWIVLLALMGNPIMSCIVPGLLIGLPAAVAAACLYKAIEFSAMLRLSPRSRGAILGIVSWIGFISSMGVIVPIMMPEVVARLLRWCEPIATRVDVPFFGWLIGAGPTSHSLWFPVAIAWIFGGTAIGFSVWASVRAARQGLAGGFGSTAGTVKIVNAADRRKWLRDPLYRKELLWFARDRSAVIQTILIPLSVAAIQLINLRAMLEMATGQWHWLCTVAVIFGTYFLFVLGPRSLVSEGPALWIAFTWPRGMESLLKAKAQLWSLLASIPVGLGLVLAAVLFPAAWWKIALVAIGWWLFGRSLAQKAVTLVQMPSSSGEPEPVPRGRRMAAWLGTLTFATGIASQQWYLAVTGVVFSWVTAAAMWQNFRERLPFLFDPWSERLPHPPTLMHAMVAIFAMVEVVSVVSGVAIGSGNGHYLWMVRAITYGVVALFTWVFMRFWLLSRGVPDRAIWYWEDSAGKPSVRWWESLSLGAICGAVLGFGAWAYSASLSRWWPQAAESFQAAADYFSQHPEERLWYAFAGVICAPLAEEYLFRGLLFRALDREWGYRRALLGSAAFFAIYHPPGAWGPVFALGLLNAWLFKSTRSLWPSVAAHTAYNLVVVLA